MGAFRVCGLNPGRDDLRSHDAPRPIVSRWMALRPWCAGKKGPQVDNSTIERPLTAEELSAILPLHPETIRKWAREGKIPSVRISARKILFLPSEIQAWLASRNRYTQAATRAAQPERMAA